MATKMDPLDLQRKRIPNPRGIIIEALAFSGELPMGTAQYHEAFEAIA